MHGGRAEQLRNADFRRCRPAPRPDTPDQRVVTIGRVTTGVIMVLAMLWSTQGEQFRTIFEAVNKIPMTFAPAVTTVFVLGLL